MKNKKKKKKINIHYMDIINAYLVKTQFYIVLIVQKKEYAKNVIIMQSVDLIIAQYVKMK